MDRRSVAPPHPKSTFTTGRSAIDLSRETLLTIMSFANEWHFKPEGVDLVKKRFEAELAIAEHTQPWDFQVENRWIPEYSMWQVRCAKVDCKRVWTAFFTVMNGVIREAIHRANQKDEDIEECTIDDEDADEDYDFGQDTPLDSNLIQRLAVWKTQSAARGLSPELAATSQLTQIDDQLMPVVDEDSFPAEIRYYKFRQAWNCVDKTIMLNDLLPEDDLKELVRLTSCQFSKNLNEGIVFVGAHEEANLHLAVHKLNNIEKNWPYRHPWVNHVFYTEETANTKYALKYFVDMKMFYFETTLLDELQVIFSNGACDYETLTSAITVRCAPYVPVKSTYVQFKTPKLRKIEVEDIPGGIKVFSTAYTYNGKGDLSENPMLYRPAQDPERVATPAAQTNSQQLQNALAPHLRSGPHKNPKDESVQKWATEIPDPISLGVALAPEGLPDGLRIQANGISGGQAKSHKPTWDRYEEYSPEKTADIVEKELSWKAKVGPIGVIRRTSGSTGPGVLNPYSNITNKNGVTRHPTSEVPRSASMPQVTSSSDGLMIPLTPIILHQQPLQSIAEPRPQARQPDFLKQVSRSHTRSASQTDTVPPQELSSNRRLFSETIARHNNVQLSLLDEDDPVLESLEYKILDPIFKRPGFQMQTEKEQSEHEPDNRVFHQTMKQRAPKPNPHHFASRHERPFSPPMSAASSQPGKSLTDPLCDLVEEMNQSFRELLAGLRGYRGKVVVQAEFGRIILGRLHPKWITQGSDHHLLDGVFLHKMLIQPTEYGPTADFTSVLTTIPAEIQYMVNMKGRGEQNLWQADIVSGWSTTYEFVFTDPRDPLYPVMIEIDAETFVAQIKARCRLGNLFIHGTKRHWDLKVAAIGYGNSQILENKYGELATAIQATLFIPSNSHRPYLSWKLDNSLQKKFLIQDVTVRRVYEYKSTIQDSTLKVSELQSLDINGGPTEKSYWVFEALPSNPDQPPIEKLTTWYEASITSVKLDDVLKQNESLDLGDETAWTLEDTANMEVSKAIYSPALEMLKQMDCVGQNGHNGSDYRSRKPSKHVMQAQAKEPVVWW
ncbi:hypothetical protein ONS95_011341 [Cadophora gregata]|uniref:uncharacterized protein n=1 Tax=Cadophora gregata TaxID=51156 RepID=UPI0026DBE020|nr:uncharacterized protein ONS95_011341 [Cadophora gregata]KAK0119916.1 hypothetical protein ONS95_011341 [Cadophora gregata]KAK0120949.1 hypothetical protein ONS96_011144 [Cadophora gregata f. sp. sojae]